MNGTKILAMCLIVGGALGLAYGKFSYNKQTEKAKVGNVELVVNDKETVNIPVWAGVVAIAGGAVLLLGGKKLTS